MTDLRRKGPVIGGTLLFSLAGLGQRIKIHPAYIPRAAAYGGDWLHLAARADDVAIRCPPP